MSDAAAFDHDIAIIGLSGRFPGAADIEALWHNLRAGVESITVFSDDELLAAGVDPTTLRNPHYVKASGAIDGVELFDAAFFDLTPREAEVLDPQQRFFLECAVAALEHAGYDSSTYEGLIGVYAGSNISNYLLLNLATNREILAAVGGYQTILANDKDFLPTRVSYKLNLRGPSVNVNTACSTSLVAVHLACQALLNGECDLALAGGVGLSVQRAGYWYQEGGVNSPDGHCRAFDAAAQGTVDGSGIGVAVLKRLEDALADGDTIHAVIRGSAINNDGAQKVGYTAPSIDGQAAVIGEALAVAGVAPDTIRYVEGHGTGTPLGDPIEVAALTQAFGAKTERRQFCALGSIKTNIGHLGAAAGIAGLIKAVAALKHGAIPPSLHYRAPNPKIDWAHSPFFVSDRLLPWPDDGQPRRAGVSSFGIGGTNAHVILEAAPAIEPGDPAQPWQLLLLSAKTAAALEAATDNLVAALDQGEQELADIAYTLQIGRQAHDHRRMLVCRDRDDAIAALGRRNPERVLTRQRAPGARAVTFMFPGQGAQYPGMAAALYATQPTFAEWVDRCCERLLPELGLDLRALLFPAPDAHEDAARQLAQTQITQPALFVIEYALAKLWQSWGIKPQALIGHSVGEYVAATLAGVFRLDDALALVALRGRLIAELPGGAMLSVPLPAHEVETLLAATNDRDLALAAVNAPALCVVSGPTAAIDALAETLRGRGVDCRQLHTSHAFHSPMLDPIVDRFAAAVEGVARKAPKLPFVSNVTGTWISAAEATDARYWARQLREPVRFADGLQTLLADGDRILLEVGPGRTLGIFAQQQPGKPSSRTIIAALPGPKDQQPERAVLLEALGRLWLAGVAVQWPGVYAHERRRRIPLPTYPFQRERFWIAAQLGAYAPTASAALTEAPGAPAHATGGSMLELHARPADERLVPYAPPETPIERKIVEIMQELLGIEPVGIHDNFFELGGHSLMATQLISRVRQIFQIELPLDSIFDTTTVAQLAAAVQEQFIARLEALPEDEAQLLLEQLSE